MLSKSVDALGGIRKAIQPSPPFLSQVSLLGGATLLHSQKDITNSGKMKLSPTLNTSIGSTLLESHHPESQHYEKGVISLSS